MIEKDDLWYQDWDNERKYGSTPIKEKLEGVLFTKKEKSYSTKYCRSSEAARGFDADFILVLCTKNEAEKHKDEIKTYYQCLYKVRGGKLLFLDEVF